MKKYDEEIIKYFSGLLNDEEKSKFLQKLKTDHSLKEEYDRLNNSIKELSSVRNSVELNETYFNNLLPKVKNNLKDYKKRSLLKEYALIAPAALIVLIVSYITFVDLKKESDFATSIANEVVKNIDDEELANNLLKDYTFESIIPYQKSEIDLEIYFPENVSLSLNNISQYIDFAKLDYSQIENISDPEFEKLYNNLSTLNFQKVSK